MGGLLCFGGVAFLWGFQGFCAVQELSGLLVYSKCLVGGDFVVEEGSHEEVSGSGGDGWVLNF